jgi:hypothetical protein
MKISWMRRQIRIFTRDALEGEFEFWNDKFADINNMERIENE